MTVWRISGDARKMGRVYVMETTRMAQLVYFAWSHVRRMEQLRVGSEIR